MNNPQGPVYGGGQNPANQSTSEEGYQFAQEPKRGASSGDKKKDNLLTMVVVEMIVKFSIHLTVFLLPLFFLTKVPSPLELNKQFLMVIVVGIGFLSWVGKMAWKNEIRVKKNFIMVPIMTFVAILGLSTIFSSYSEQSLWGYFGGEGKSFVTTLFLVAFFLLVVNNMKTKSEATKVVITFIVSGFLTSLYGMLQIWGVFILPSEGAKSEFFNTVGSVYVFSAYAGALFLMSLTLFLSNVSKLLKMILIVLCFFFFFVMMAVNFKVVWVTLILCMAVIFGVAILRGSAEGQSRVLPMIFLVLSLLMVLRSKPLIEKALPVEVLLSHKSSTSIALNSLKDNALLGSGLTTYSGVYQMARPENLGDFWAVNFNDGVSYFITLASTTGILGTISFLFLVGVGLLLLLKMVLNIVSAGKDKNADYIGIGTGVVWLFSTIILFFYLSNITFLLLWWLSLALFVSFSSFEAKGEVEEFVTTSDTPKSSLVLSFVFVLVIIGLVAAIYLQSQKYIAAVHFGKALTADAQGESLDVVATEISDAVDLDPGRDLYHRNLSVAFFALANKRIAERGADDLTPEDSNYVSEMLRAALSSAEAAIILNPSNAENYISLANIYEGVLITMDGADELAIDNYMKAIEFDPRNPVLHYRLANVYVLLSDAETSSALSQGIAVTEPSQESLEYLALAKENLIKSLELKADYASSNLLLAGVYEREGDMQKAIEKEEETRALFPTAPGVAFRLGLLYYKDEQFDNAKRELFAAVALDKDYSNARYFLGLILDKEGDTEGALEQFEKIAELNPENEDVKDIVSNLESGRDALEGLFGTGEEFTQPPAAPAVENQGQPQISPDVENQQIPEEAVPAPEEVQNP